MHHVNAPVLAFTDDVGKTSTNAISADRAKVEPDMSFGGIVSGGIEVAINRSTDHITRREFTGWMVIKGKPPPSIIDEMRSLAAYRFADQKARCVFFRQCGRMKLKKFEVTQHRPRSPRHRNPIPRAYTGIRRFCEHLTTTTRRQDHRPCAYPLEPAAPDDRRPHAPSAIGMNPQIQDKRIIKNLNIATLAHAIAQGADHGASGGIRSMKDTTMGMGSF